MILLLRETGDTDSADEACAFDEDGESTAVVGIVYFGEMPIMLYILAVALQDSTDVERGLLHLIDGVHLSFYPAEIIGGGAGEGTAENLRAADGDIDGDGIAAAFGFVYYHQPNVQCIGIGEMGELQELLLTLEQADTI